MAFMAEYKIISGRSVEVRRCWISGRKGEGKQKRLPRKAGSSSLKKILRNEQESVRRLARTINSNFTRGDIFITRKYSNANLPACLEEAEEEFKKLMRKVKDSFKKQTGKSLKYVWNASDRDPKTGAKVRVHCHCVMNAVAYELLLSMISDKDELEYAYLDNRGDHTALAVYMIGNGKSETANKKKWHSSRGLEKPVITEPEAIEEICEIEAPAGAEIRENTVNIDQETGAANAYLRFVLPEKPVIKGSTVYLPKVKRGGRKK